MLRYKPDLAVRNERGNIVADVEVRGQENVTNKEAARIRQIVLDHGADVTAPFFALITPTSGFIWRANPPGDADPAHPRLPDVSFSTTSLTERYVPGPRAPGRFNRSNYGIVVFNWLSELTNGTPPDPIEADTAVTQSGLIDAAKYGSVDWNYEQ